MDKSRLPDVERDEDTETVKPSTQHECAVFISDIAAESFKNAKRDAGMVGPNPIPMGIP